MLGFNPVNKRSIQINDYPVNSGVMVEGTEELSGKLQAVLNAMPKKKKIIKLMVDWIAKNWIGKTENHAIIERFQLAKCNKARNSFTEFAKRITLVIF